MYTSKYNEQNNEYEIYKDGEVFCYLSETDYEYFKSNFSQEIEEL